MLESLRLLNFRCFEQLSIELPEQGAIFIGENAQGKTSILEAACVLVRLHSPRSKKLQPMVKFESPEFGVAGTCWDEDMQVRFSRGNAAMQVNGGEVKTQSEYLQSSGLIVWMGNEDVELIRGSGGVRRHYLDFICSQVDGSYRRALSRYRKVLKARNLLLKEMRSTDQELAAYGELLVEYGDYITSVRSKVVEELLPHAQKAQLAISGKDESLSLEYVSGSGGDMAKALETTFQSERRQRQTLAGPHRDEVRILLNGMTASEYASEGQQRTIALALKLGQGELLRQLANKYPVYLLDDVFGELDPLRRNALIGYLPDDAQKLITTTTLDWLDDEWSDWQRFEVRGGEVN